MAEGSSGENELRQQLREAYRQIGELRWQLQSEQQNRRRQDRLLTEQAGAMAEAREEHEQEMADREQEIADLEDEQGGSFRSWEKGRTEGLRPARVRLGEPGLRVMGELLRWTAEQAVDGQIAGELREWERRVRVMLEMEDELNRRPAGEGATEAALRRVAAGRGNAGCTFDIAIEDREVSSDQLLLCGLLVDGWLGASEAGSGKSVAMHRDAQRRAIRLDLMPGSGAEDLWLRAAVENLRAHAAFDPEHQTLTVTFPAAG
ncbi:MAG: hypothetical protein SFV54_23425 [Bryobacteraceae bacterium]|nr:hypothetical protein [Bryobacteraceae bacterium]